jgi:uncharacterized membrane-anchored protein YitT (DUF2179 family)
MMFGFGALGLANLVIFILAILTIVFQDNTVKALVGIAVAGKVISGPRSQQYSPPPESGSSENMFR